MAQQWKNFELLRIPRIVTHSSLIEGSAKPIISTIIKSMPFHNMVRPVQIEIVQCTNEFKSKWNAIQRHWEKKKRNIYVSMLINFIRYCTIWDHCWFFALGRGLCSSINRPFHSTLSRTHTHTQRVDPI